MGVSPCHGRGSHPCRPGWEAEQRHVLGGHSRAGTAGLAQPSPPTNQPANRARGLGCGGEGAAGGGILPCWSCVGAAASAEPGWCQPGAGGGKGAGLGAAGDGGADGAQGTPPPVAGAERGHRGAEVGAEQWPCWEAAGGGGEGRKGFGAAAQRAGAGTGLRWPPGWGTLRARSPGQTPRVPWGSGLCR